MEQTQNSQSGTDRSKDTSLPGREEEVVNQQEGNHVTNSDESNETTNADSVPKMSNGGSQRYDDSHNGETGEKRYQEGIGNNSDTQDPPEIGKEDAEKTQQETPRMK
ncbi:MAG: hypothetical protein ABIY51_08780 [Ferruginibacter sp.]